jgi:hydroxyethylthiazole kinase-like uncharacterized protein yjeF
MRIVSHLEMKQIENYCDKECGFTEDLIIENVGNVGSQFVSELLKGTSLASVVVFAGNGNNGADGIAIARHLQKYQIQAYVIQLFSSQTLSAGLEKQIKLAKKYDVKFFQTQNLEEISSLLVELKPNLLIDALFGTGLRLPLPNVVYDLIKFMNQLDIMTVSLDIPTGVLCDSGNIQGNAIQADYTLAIGYPKLGHYLSDGAKHTGVLKIMDVGFPVVDKVKANKFLLNPKNLLDINSKRSKFSHKNNFGHLLVIGGSYGMTGAPTLSSHAALAAGTGLVTTITWEDCYKDLLVKLKPEIMTGFIPQDQALWDKEIKKILKYDAIVIGPGLGKSERSRKLVLEVLNNFNGPVVIDADAINVLNLKQDSQIFSIRNAPTVLTPHYGEFSRFTNSKIEDVLENPVQMLKNLVEMINCSVILKGPCTLVGQTSGSIYFNYLPNDGMAKAGSGDVLAGIIGGLFAQHFSKSTSNKTLVDEYRSFDKIVSLGVYLHSQAGLQAANQFGTRSMTASTIIESMKDAFLNLNKNHE